MTENIKFQQVVVDGVIIKMRRDNICCHIICRMLYRCKRVDILTKWENDDSSRMLSGTSSNSGTTL